MKSGCMKGGSIMSIRITSKQVEAAAKAREKALKDNPEYDDGFGEMPEVDIFEDSEPKAEEKKTWKEKT